QRGDARLVAEGREIIDAGQAHDLPPRVHVVRAALAGRPLDPLGVPFQQPEKERPRRALVGRLGIEGMCHDSSPLNSRPSVLRRRYAKAISKAVSPGDADRADQEPLTIRY